MSEEQEAVIEVEQTTNTDPAPVETNVNAPVETPAAELNGTEREVSKSVPYERFAEVNAEKKALEEQLAAARQPQRVAQPQYQAPTDEFLDPESASAVDRRARMIFEQNEQAKFDSKHAKDFAADKLLKAAFLVQFDEARQQGIYMDRETALDNAKAEIARRSQPQVEKAKEEGLREGQDIAKTKQQLGAVGAPGKAVEVNEDELSSAEFAKLNKIPRI